MTLENGDHDLLPLDTVQALTVEFFRSGRVGTDRVTVAAPRFPTVAEAQRPAPRR